MRKTLSKNYHYNQEHRNKAIPMNVIWKMS